MKLPSLILIVLLTQINWFLLVLGPYQLGIAGSLILCGLVIKQDKGHFLSQALLPALVGFAIDHIASRQGWIDFYRRHDCICYLFFLWINFCASFPLIRFFLCRSTTPLIFTLAPLSYLGAEKLATTAYRDQNTFFYHMLLWFIYGLLVRGYFMKRGYFKDAIETTGAKNE